MKIDSKMAAYEIAKQLPNNAAGIGGDKKALAETKPEPAVPESQDAVVHLSRASQEVRLADGVIEAAPATRSDKVAEVKAKIEAGDYKIDHEEIASRMVDQDLDELL